MEQLTNCQCFSLGDKVRLKTTSAPPGLSNTERRETRDGNPRFLTSFSCIIYLGEKETWSFLDPKFAPSVMPTAFGKRLLKRFVLHFIYLFWERERESVHEQGRGRERERENPKQAVHCQRRARQGAGTVRSWPEPKSRVGCLTDWPTQAPLTISKHSAQ